MTSKDNNDQCTYNEGGSQSANTTSFVLFCIALAGHCIVLNCYRLVLYCIELLTFGIVLY